MKRLMSVMLVLLLLTITLTSTSLAMPPRAVSGTVKAIFPPFYRTWWRAGNNCFVKVGFEDQLMGDLEGEMLVHFRITSHGPCEPPGGPVPYTNHETIKGWGTFTGTVLGRSGTFDFSLQGHLWPADPGEVLATPRLVILQGTGDLADLHGLVDWSWIMGAEIGPYVGRVHFD